MVTEAPARATEKPKKRRWLWPILGLVAILLLSMILTWLLSPVRVDEPVPATVKTDDEVFVASKPGAAGALVKRIHVVTPGSVIQVPDGNEAFLFMQGGVISRIEGPAEVHLVESRRSIDAPSALQAILAQRGGDDPTGKTKTESSLRLEVLSGTVILKGFTSRPNFAFSIKAGSLYSRPEGSAFQVSVRHGGEVWWDTLEGQPVVGMVSGPEGGRVAGGGAGGACGTEAGGARGIGGLQGV